MLVKKNLHPTEEFFTYLSASGSSRLRQRVAGAAASGRISSENAARHEVHNVPVGGVLRALGELCPFSASFAENVSCILRNIRSKSWSLPSARKKAATGGAPDRRTRTVSGARAPGTRLLRALA